MTPAHGPWPRLRSRAFVQPLLITMAGVVASIGSYQAAKVMAYGPPDGPCTLSADTCGYMWMGALWQGLTLFPVLLLGLLITGLVVGLSSRDARLAFGAVLVGVVLPPLVASAVFVVPSAIATGGDGPFRIASNLAGAVLIGLVLLIPIAPGFGLGRVIRPKQKPGPT